jgi:hypothetical protein
MNNIEVKGSDIFLNGNKVFLIIDSTIIQNIAEANLGRELTDVELECLDNFVFPSNATFELDNYLLDCIYTAVEGEKHIKKMRRNAIKKESFNNQPAQDF